MELGGYEAIGFFGDEEVWTSLMAASPDSRFSLAYGALGQREPYGASYGVSRSLLPMSKLWSLECSCADLSRQE